MSDKAIIIAANPKHGDGGDVEVHIRYAERYDKVFWDLTPPGQHDTEWANPEIRKGYFYISGTGEVKYKFLIEDARRISEFKSSNLWDNVKKYVPDFRMNGWKNPNTGYWYGLLIKNIVKIPGISLDKFELANSNKPVERVQNYVIVLDRHAKEVV